MKKAGSVSDGFPRCGEAQHFDCLLLSNKQQISRLQIMVAPSEVVRANMSGVLEAFQNLIFNLFYSGV